MSIVVTVGVRQQTMEEEDVSLFGDYSGELATFTRPDVVGCHPDWRFKTFRVIVQAFHQACPIRTESPI